MNALQDKRKIWTAGTLTYTTAGLVMLCVWLLWGDFVWSMRERAVNNTATLMVKSFGVSDFVYSILIVAIPNFTNIFLAPIVSYRSDRHRGKYGRRIPYLFLTTPFIVAGLIGLGFTPLMGRTLHDALNLTAISEQTICLAVFSVFWLMLDFGTTLTGALFGALVNDVVPKELLGRFFGLFRAVSLAAGILFNQFVFGYAETYASVIFISLGILYGIGLYTLCWKVKEGEYPEPEQLPPGHKGPLKLTADYLYECFSLPYYRWIAAGCVLVSLVPFPFNIYTIQYAQSLAITPEEVGKCIALTFMISFCLSYPLGMLADRFHPLRLMLIFAVMYGVLSIGGFLLTTGSQSFKIMLVLHGVVSGCLATAVASYGPKLLPQSLFAQLSSSIWLVMSLAMTLTAPLTGKLLDTLGSAYEYVWIMGALFSFASAFVLWVILRKFLALGGDRNYQAPIPPSLSR